MTRTVELLAQHGHVFLLGVTILLALGLVAVLISRAPIHRQRLGEFTIAATLLWLALAAVPLPRFRVTGEASTRRLHSDRLSDSAVAHPTPLPGDVWHGEAPDGEDPSPSPEQPAPSTAPGQRPTSAARSASPAAPMATPETRRPFWRSTLAMLYLVGAAASLLWLVIGRVGLALANRAARLPPAWLSSLYRSLQSPHDGRRPELLVSPRCRRPVVFGLWRRRIILPAALCRPDNGAGLRHVLRHELAHAWRGDAWGHCLVNLACPALYFHPVYWWICREVQLARELIADDWAAGFGTKESYIEELVRLVQPHPFLPGSMGVLGMVRFRTQFFRRMTMLIDRRKRLAVGTSKWWRWMAVSAGALILAVTAWLVGLPPAGGGQDASGTAAAGSNADMGDQPAPAAESARKADDPEQQDADRATSGQAPRDAGGAGRPVGEENGPASPPDLGPDQIRKLIERGYMAPSRRFRPGPMEAADVIRADDCFLTLMTDIKVSARVAGVLTEIAVKEGMEVERGQSLARMDDEQARVQLELAEAALDGAKALEASVELAKTEAEHAARVLQRMKALKEEGTASDSEESRARRDADSSLLRLRIAQEEYGSTRRLRELQVEAARADVALREVKAPTDGIVIETYCQPGEWLNPGDPICRIIRLDPLRVQGYLDARHAEPHALVGRDVEVLLKLARGERLPERVFGKITYVSPIVEAGSKLLFQAEIQNPTEDGRFVLRPGLTADVAIMAGTAERPTSKADTAERPRSEEERFPHVLSFRLGKRTFAEGDNITITEIRGTRPKLEIGGRYLVRGEYTLSSQDSASLCLFRTTTKPGTGRIKPTQRMEVQRGSGVFALEKEIYSDGYLHLSFYPSGGRSSFGGLYFGQNDRDTWTR